MSMIDLFAFGTLTVTSYNTTRRTTIWTRTHLRQACSHCGKYHLPGAATAEPDPPPKV